MQEISALSLVIFLWPSWINELRCPVKCWTSFWICFKVNIMRMEFSLNNKCLQTHLWISFIKLTFWQPTEITPDSCTSLTCYFNTISFSCSHNATTWASPISSFIKYCVPFLLYVLECSTFTLSLVFYFTGLLNKVRIMILSCYFNGKDLPQKLQSRVNKLLSCSLNVGNGEGFQHLFQVLLLNRDHKLGSLSRSKIIQKSIQVHLWPYPFLLLF